MDRRPLLDRIEPLREGRETEIDMIEREMEGGVVIIQPLEIDEPPVTPSGEPTT
jgi:hypothetical protein